MSTMRNTVQLIGNLGGDPEAKEFPNGNRLATMNVATTERYKQGEEWKDDTQWHRVVAWGRQAERVIEKLRKGSKVALQGRLVHRNWEGKDGQKHYMTEVVLSDFQAMGNTVEMVKRQVGQLA
jgi:single-strand DNA-binding protein